MFAAAAHFIRFQANASSNTAFRTITTGAATITPWLNRRPAAWPATPITMRTGAVPAPNATIAIAPIMGRAAAAAAVSAA